MTYQSVNPYNEKTLQTFDELTDQQLEAALKSATTCFWRSRKCLITVFATLGRHRFDWGLI